VTFRRFRTDPVDDRLLDDLIEIATHAPFGRTEPALALREGQIAGTAARGFGKLRQGQ